VGALVIHLHRLTIIAAWITESRWPPIRRTAMERTDW
jgi:hypothetical protein